MVGIKDFNMPSCCDDCQIFSFGGYGGDEIYCAMTGETLERCEEILIDMKSDRGKRCPLVEINE